MKINQWSVCRWDTMQEETICRGLGKEWTFGPDLLSFGLDWPSLFVHWFSTDKFYLIGSCKWPQQKRRPLYYKFLAWQFTDTEIAVKAIKWIVLSPSLSQNRFASELPINIVICHIWPLRCPSASSLPEASSKQHWVSLCWLCINIGVSFCI